MHIPTQPWLLHPSHSRTIENGRYTLFGVECSQPVMAAYERSWNRRHMGPLERDADLLKGWCVEVALLQGDFDAVANLRHVLERLGVDV